HGKLAKPDPSALIMAYKQISAHVLSQKSERVRLEEERMLSEWAGPETAKKVIAGLSKGDVFMISLNDPKVTLKLLVIPKNFLTTKEARKISPHFRGFKIIEEHQFEKLVRKNLGIINALQGFISQKD
ncbi:MAG: hypothetical protein NUV67_05505, partial [archaeon]|nr:hypothetical protein [archaeon]